MSLYNDKTEYLDRKLKNQPDASVEEVQYWSDKWDRESPKSLMNPNRPSDGIVARAARSVISRLLH